MLQSASNKPLQPSINVKPGATLVEIVSHYQALSYCSCQQCCPKNWLKTETTDTSLIKVLIKGIISRSPDSCTFPLVENISIYSLEVSSFSFVNHNIQTLSCQETAWEIPPMTRACGQGLMGKVESGLEGLPGSIPPLARSCGETWWARQIRTQGIPWACSSIYLRTRNCLFHYFMSFTNTSNINRVLSPTTFIWRKQLRALVNNSPGHYKSVPI